MHGKLAQKFCHDAKEVNFRLLHRIQKAIPSKMEGELLSGGKLTLEVKVLMLCGSFDVRTLHAKNKHDVPWDQNSSSETCIFKSLQWLLLNCLSLGGGGGGVR